MRLTHVQGSTAPLSLVHISNNVETTFDFDEATFDFVAKNGKNVELVYRENFVLSTESKQLNNLFRFCRKNRSTLLLVLTALYGLTSMSR